MDHTLSPFSGALNEDDLEEMIQKAAQDERVLKNRKGPQDVLFESSMNVSLLETLDDDHLREILANANDLP